MKRLQARRRDSMEYPLGLSIRSIPDVEVCAVAESFQMALDGAHTALLVHVCIR